MRKLDLRLGALLAQLALATAATAQGQFWTVDSRGGADFGGLQQAISAAANGDVLAVRGGPFNPITINGRQLTLVADQGPVEVEGTCQVFNIAEGGTLTFVGPLQFTRSLAVRDCAGTVWLEEGRAVSLDARDCDDLVLVDYTAEGPSFSPSLNVRDSQVHAYRSALIGLEGRAGVALGPFQPGCIPIVDICKCECCTIFPPFGGGEGVDLHSSTMIAAACLVEGGMGGRSTRIEGCLFQEGGMCGANGGAGLRFVDSSYVQIGGSIGGGFGTLDTYPPPTSPFSPGPCYGVDGEDIVGNGTLNQVSATVGRFDAPAAAPAGQAFDLTFARSAEGLAFWSWTTSPDPVYVPGLHGTVFAAQACNLAGVVTPGAPLVIASPTVQLPPRIEAITVVLQAYYVESAPLRVIAGPPQATVIHR